MYAQKKRGPDGDVPLGKQTRVLKLGTWEKMETRQPRAMMKERVRRKMLWTAAIDLRSGRESEGRDSWERTKVKEM